MPRSLQTKASSLYAWTAARYAAFDPKAARCGTGVSGSVTGPQRAAGGNRLFSLARAVAQVLWWMASEDEPNCWPQM